jgi:hypothetical protein
MNSGRKRYRAKPLPAVAAVVLEAEGDATVIEADQSAVWWVIAEPQLWSTAVAPMRAPRCFGSAAMVSNVSDAVRNNRS